MSDLARIEAKIDRLMAHLGVGVATSGASAKAGATPAASDADLDGQYGDPVVRKDPSRWSGASYVGYPFSECPADYLDVVAEFNDWRAKKDDEKGAAGEKQGNGKPKDGFYARLDAARARGWAERHRQNGGAAPVARARPKEDPEENLPF